MVEKLKVEWMPLKEFKRKFKRAPFNPPRRTKEKTLRKLVASMRKNGYWSFQPIIIAKGNWIADGHRRLAAAEAADIEEVAYTITDRDVQELWAEMNGTTRAPSIRETGEAIALGLTVIPPEREVVVNRLLETMGTWDAVREVLEKGASPGIVNIARQVANYCEMAGDNEFTARTIHWLIKHKLAVKARRAIDDSIQPETLFNRITNDQPIAGRWD